MIKKQMGWRIASLLVIVVLGLSGCSINHPVEQDYQRYLELHPADTTLPHSELAADYVIDSETETHRYEFRAATVGYAHLWIVEFGKILDQTLNSTYVQAAFNRLDKRNPSATDDGELVEFLLKSYEFKDYRAYVTMNIKLLSNGNVVLNNIYEVEGVSQGADMWVQGPFGMTSGTLESTKSAIDKILTQFVKDYQILQPLP